MHEKRFKFLPIACIRRHQEPNCPVVKGEEFTTNIDDPTDPYGVYQSLPGDHPTAGKWFAACPICHSHTNVIPIED